MRFGIQPAVTGSTPLLLFVNRALASEGAVASATSEAAAGNMVAANLTSPRLDLAWRSGSLAELFDRGVTEISIYLVFDRPRCVSFVALHRTNIRRALRLRLWKESALAGRGATPLYDGPWTSPVVRSEPGDYPTFSAMPWTLGISGERLDKLTANHRLDCILPADARYPNVRIVEIQIDVGSGSNGDGVDYVQVGHPFAGEEFRPAIGMELGWEMGVIDRSEKTRTKSGAVHGVGRSRGRTIALGLHALERGEAFVDVFQRFAVDRGSLGHVWIWPEPAHRTEFHEQAFLGSASTLPKVAMARLDWPASTGWLIEETE